MASAHDSAKNHVNMVREAATGTSRFDTTAVHSASVFPLLAIPKPLQVLLIHLIWDAIIFSVVAGLDILVNYGLRGLSLNLLPLFRLLFPFILIADLLLLLLSISRIVFRTLRDV